MKQRSVVLISVASQRTYILCRYSIQSHATLEISKEFYLGGSYTEKQTLCASITAMRMGESLIDGLGHAVGVYTLGFSRMAGAESLTRLYTR